jgi:hypothetical protein
MSEYDFQDEPAGMYVADPGYVDQAVAASEERIAGALAGPLNDIHHALALQQQADAARFQAEQSAYFAQVAEQADKLVEQRLGPEYSLNKEKVGDFLARNPQHLPDNGTVENFADAIQTAYQLAQMQEANRAEEKRRAETAIKSNKLRLAYDEGSYSRYRNSGGTI